MLISELVPTNGRKSFYGKAKIYSIEGTSYLKSYDTLVASVDADGKTHRYADSISSTTNCHVKSFVESASRDIGTTKEFYALPLEEKPKVMVAL